MIILSKQVADSIVFAGTKFFTIKTNLSFEENIALFIKQRNNPGFDKEKEEFFLFKIYEYYLEKTTSEAEMTKMAKQLKLITDDHKELSRLIFIATKDRLLALASD